MIQLTFPDNSSRAFPDGVTGREIAEGISKSLAKKAVAMTLDGKLSRPFRPDRAGRQDRDRHARRSAGARAHPARRRPRHGRGGAGALSRHPGDHRPGDRERLLLRLLPERALHHRRPAGDRGEDAGDRREERCPSPRRSGRATRREQVFRDKGEMFKVELVDAIPESEIDQDLPAGRLVRPLPRAAYGLDRPDRQRLQADEGGRRLLAGRLATIRC